MIVRHKCEKCESKFELSFGTTLIESEVNNAAIAESKGKSLYLTKVVCPYCFKEEIVQVDNEETKELFSRLLSAIRMSKTIKKKSKRQSAQIRKMNEELDAKRAIMLKAFKDESC